MAESYAYQYGIVCVNAVRLQVGGIEVHINISETFGVHDNIMIHDDSLCSNDSLTCLLRDPYLTEPYKKPCFARGIGVQTFAKNKNLGITTKKAAKPYSTNIRSLQWIGPQCMAPCLRGQRSHG